MSLINGLIGLKSFFSYFYLFFLKKSFCINLILFFKKNIEPVRDHESLVLPFTVNDMVRVI